MSRSPILTQIRSTVHGLDGARALVTEIQQMPDLDPDVVKALTMTLYHLEEATSRLVAIHFRLTTDVP